MSDGTVEVPIYRKSPETDWTGKTPLFMIVCDEGWRESIVCNRMYEWAADWLVSVLQGKPYAAGFRP